MTDGTAWDFGMALGRMNLSPSDVPDFLSFPHLHALELPYESVLSPKGNFQLHAFFPVLCGAVMEPDLSRAIVHATERHRADFAEELRHALALLPAKGIHAASLDFGLEDILGDADSEYAAREILQRVASVLEKEKLTLLLPVRAPSAHPPAEACRFLRQTLLPFVKARLDIHPYVKERPVPESCGMLRWELGAMLFTYDADCGNRIQKEAVQPWLEWASRPGWRMPVLLAPMSHSQRMSLPEAAAWDGIAAEIENEKEERSAD